MATFACARRGHYESVQRAGDAIPSTRGAICRVLGGISPPKPGSIFEAFAMVVASFLPSWGMLGGFNSKVSFDPMTSTCSYTDPDADSIVHSTAGVLSRTDDSRLASA